MRVDNAVTRKGKKLFDKNGNIVCQCYNEANAETVLRAVEWLRMPMEKRKKLIENSVKTSKKLILASFLFISFSVFGTPPPPPPLPPGFKIVSNNKITSSIITETNCDCKMMLIKFKTETNKIYQLQYTKEFKNWVILEPTLEGTGDYEYFFDVIDNNRFYRLAIFP